MDMYGKIKFLVIIEIMETLVTKRICHKFIRYLEDQNDILLFLL